MRATELFGALLMVAIGVAVALFRKGGVYNPTTNPMPPPPAPQAPKPPQFAPIVEKWASAIAIQEGAHEYLNNPGNLKYSSLTASWGGTKGRQALDGGWLCQFPTLEAGQTALCHFLTLACEGELIISHPKPCTLEAFSKRYAGNPPQAYIDHIAAALNLPFTVDIATFLS